MGGSTLLVSPFDIYDAINTIETIFLLHIHNEMPKK
jgi:hypothetical protein